MKKVTLLLCSALFGITVSATVVTAIDDLPKGTKPLKRNEAMPLTKSECQTLGGNVEHEGELKYCGGKGMCVVQTKDSIYGACVTEMKAKPKAKAKTDVAK